MQGARSGGASHWERSRPRSHTSQLGALPPGRQPPGAGGCGARGGRAPERGAGGRAGPGEMAENGFEYDLVTVGAGSGGTRASRISSQVYGAKVACVELPFDFRASDTHGGAGGTCGAPAPTPPPAHRGLSVATWARSQSVARLSM